MRRTSRTSIFSNQYQKKQRRKKFLQRLFLIIFILAALILVFRKPILEMVEKVKQDIVQENVQKEEILENLPETIVNEEVETPVEEEPVVEKIYINVTLPDGKAFPLELLEEAGERVFAPLTELVAMEGDLSPTRKQAVILDQATQDLFLVDLEGVVTDITYKIYKTKKGYTEPKEKILGRIEGFVWAEQPKFLDEDTVVYMSQLPWFDERRFLYIVELAPLSHRHFQSVFGTDVVLKELTETGLAYETKGNTYYLTPEYKIVKP